MAETAEQQAVAETVPTERKTVDFWFDPACPWAWITSRWIVEAAKVRPIDVRWHIMSLTMLNEGRDLSPDYMEGMKRALGPVRVFAAVQQRFGDEAVGRLYTEVGKRFHNEKLPRERATIEDALEAAGLPRDLAGCADTDEYDERLRASHEDGMNRVGMEVGTPIIAVEGHAIFGPVISPAPKGEAAGKLWDGVVLVMGTDGFYELKRTRNRKPIFD